MNLSKLDHVDWWMAAIGWSPAVVLSTGPGTAHAGELDAFTSHDNSDTQNLKVVGGYTKSVNDHGAAVASLMAGMEDKLGVMGVAPKSQILLYNPFDATGTAKSAPVSP